MDPQEPVPRDTPWPTVLGIDPGTRATGYGALVVTPEGPRLVACGCLRAPHNMDIARRLARIGLELDGLLGRLRPHWVAVEAAFVARNVKSALRIGEARGMVLSTAGRRELNVVEISPAEAKKAVIGHGGGSKPQVAAMVALLLGARSLNVPADATDALAIALAQVRRMTSPLNGARRTGSTSHGPHR